MKQGTTPTLPITVKGQNLVDMRVYVAFRCNGKVLEKTNEDMTITYDAPDTILAVRLTQQETLQFQVGWLDIDARWVGRNGDTWGTDVARIKVTESIIKRPLEYKEVKKICRLNCM